MDGSAAGATGGLNNQGKGGTGLKSKNENLVTLSL
jgi:hypothetical protein